MKVLVADDDEVTIKILTYWFTSRSHQLTAVTNGQQAWDLLQNENFDLLVTDYIMPGMDGLELCRRIKASHIHIQIVMISVSDFSSDIQEAKRLGVDAYFVKPITTECLNCTVGKVTEFMTRTEQIRDIAA